MTKTQTDLMRLELGREKEKHKCKLNDNMIELSKLQFTNNAEVDNQKSEDRET